MKKPDKLNKILINFYVDYENALSPDWKPFIAKAKAEIEKHYISRDKVREALVPKTKDTKDYVVIGYNQAIKDFTERLGL